MPPPPSFQVCPPRFHSHLPPMVCFDLSIPCAMRGDCWESVQLSRARNRTPQRDGRMWATRSQVRHTRCARCERTINAVLQNAFAMTLVLQRRATSLSRGGSHIGSSREPQQQQNSWRRSDRLSAMQSISRVQQTQSFETWARQRHATQRDDYRTTQKARRRASRERRSACECCAESFPGAATDSDVADGRTCHTRAAISRNFRCGAARWQTLQILRTAGHRFASAEHVALRR